MSKPLTRYFDATNPFYPNGGEMPNRPGIARRSVVLYPSLLILAACGPSPTISGGGKQTTVQSFRDKLRVRIDTTIIFDRDLSIFAGRLLDYLERGGVSGVSGNADVEFLLNTPLELIGAAIATPFDRANNFTLERKPSEVVVTYSSTSPKVMASDLPRDQRGLPDIVHAKYRSNYRWSATLAASLIYSTASKTKLFSRLQFDFAIEQRHALGWGRTEGDWIDHEGLERLRVAVLGALNENWFRKIEDRFTLPSGSVNIKHGITDSAWESEPCKRCWF